MMARLVWKLAAGTAVLGAGTLARKAMAAGWQRTKGTPPPEEPESPRTSWREALGWAAASGLAAGLARTFARRAAAQGWRKATGRTPPGVAA